MNHCEQLEPKVIDNEMLEKCIYEQAPAGEGGRLAREEGIPLEEVEQLRLEFLRILRIDHLWMMTTLTKLSLSNNLIEKIENLDELVHLTELDLSFNKITKIENLDSLVHLEFFSLFENRIEKLENMNTLKKLHIFTIGQNKIEDKINVVYLRRFRNLKSLNMEQNPCAEEEGFLTFLAALLPQLVYYQYKLVPEEERETGYELHSSLLRDIEEEEGIKKAVEDKIQAEIEEAELHAGSFVEFLGSDYLFKQLFEEDEEGKALLSIGDEVKEFYNEYEEQFVGVTKRIFEMGQEQYLIRKTEVDQFFESIETAKKRSQEKSIQDMESFLVDKADVFDTFKELQIKLDEDTITLGEFSERITLQSDLYHEAMHRIWKELMSLELTLYEQMEEVVQTFEQTLTEMINIFIEAAQGHFTELRELEQTYMDNVSTEANAYQTLCNVQENFLVPDELIVIMSDKEALNNTLGATHDLHMQLIDMREDKLVGRARGWLDSLITGLQKNEINRNREKILEINHFLDIQREEFEELQNSLNALGLPTDLDLAVF